MPVMLVTNAHPDVIKANRSRGVTSFSLKDCPFYVLLNGICESTLKDFLLDRK